ncbi:hypothetical protein E2C01_069922 [Portunus trituberculatus]|uniref:Uncharacterized protein n=1 Tax=Portunus trituberculatus TaxID=210409 RepID=A0A5B7HVU7_PORTR|nr:hypothetical protein [Portunus trituberculatus]
MDHNSSKDETVTPIQANLRPLCCCHLHLDVPPVGSLPLIGVYLVAPRLVDLTCESVYYYL